MSFQTDGSFTALNEGIYQVTVKDANGCLTIKEQILTNSPAPTAFTYTSQQETCGQANGQLSILTVRGGTSPYSYSIDGKNFQESTTIKGMSTGNYQLTVRDSKGCLYSESITIEGITGPAEISFTSKEASCYHNDGEITVNGVTGGTSPYSYSLDGTKYQSFATFTGLDAGPYTLYVRDANGCILSREAFVERPGAEIGAVLPVSCYGGADGSIFIIAVGGGDYTEYSINGGTSYQKDAVFRNLTAGTYSVMVKVSPECTITFDNIIIEEPEQITAVVTQTGKPVGGEANGTAVVSDVKGGTAPYTFKVDGAAYGNYPNFISLSAGEHILVITDAMGCEETILFTIDGLADLEIPNGFTPNADGYNDKWVLKGLNLFYPNCKVTVFNRWGSPVFQSNGYAQDWDGTNKGKELADGTYYYIIQLNADEKPLKGTVTIMR